MTDSPAPTPSDQSFAAPAASTVFDVAVWILDRARAADMHMPLQKLHRILFIAQAAYASLKGDGAEAGGLLMPAVFVADELGPVEPNLQRLLSDGRPEDLPAEPLSRRVSDFLEDIWRRFGHMPADRLNGLVGKNVAYAAALAAGRGMVISQASLAGSFAASAPKIAEDVRMLRSHNGAPVAVRAWKPGQPVAPIPARIGQDR